MPDYVDKVLLIGTGPMARDYAKVLKALDVPFDTLGRGTASATAYEQATGHHAFTGGVDGFLATASPASYKKAIVATGTESLGEVTRKLVAWGCKDLLVEKPGGKDIEEVIALHQSLAASDSNVYIAYNRRFYASVQQLREMAAEDGGVTSFNFEFTEWAHVIEPLQKAEGVKENWLFANSTHVIDLAFYLGGEPADMSSYIAGDLSWHPVAIFAGAGVTTGGALFTYQANWKAPGRWGVEILTARRRFYLRPLEKLQVQNIGSVAIEELPIDDEADKQFKPGLFRQTQAFLQNDRARLVSLAEHIVNCAHYTQILKAGKVQGA
ncbi:hypothetical protein [Chitinophaga sp. YIM B06452]|uniref:hypothetical protein n=1 Tax=Chitinophaga sp. YIM B06452 TaxID=3082158 RepID=UPI0031FEB937